MTTVTCPHCLKDREVKHPLKKSDSGLCRSCSTTLTARNKVKPPPKRYFRVCGMCDDVKEVSTALQAERTKCRACSDKSKCKSYTRICIDCGDEKTVKSQQLADCIRCISCAAKHRIVKSGVKPPKRIKAKLRSKPRKPKKDKVISEEAILRAKEINRKHREFLAKEKTVILVNKISDEDMISKYLETNTVVSEDEVQPWGYTDCTGIGTRGSVAGSFL